MDAIYNKNINQQLGVIISKYRYNIKYIALILSFYQIFICQNNFATEDYSSKKDLITKELIKKGFENIIVSMNENLIQVEYENRVFRFDTKAVFEIIKIVSPQADTLQKIVLVPQNRKIPIAVIEIASEDCKNYLSGRLTSKEFSDRLHIKMNTDERINETKDWQSTNSSLFRFDLIFKPDLNFEFGPYSDPVLYQINLVPEIRTSLWKGMSLSYELIIPIANKFGSRSDSVRPGIMALNQVFRLPGSLFISSSIGAFSQNRYGYDFEARKFLLDDNLILTADIGLTSYLSFSGMSRFYYSKTFIGTGYLDAEYMLENSNLTFGIMAGKFLGGDESIRLDVTTEVGEVSIGLFAVRSFSGISNGGFTLRIPLFPSEYSNPAFFRIRGSDYFERSYLIKGNVQDLIGLRYNTGNRMDKFIKNLTPESIKRIFRECN